MPNLGELAQKVRSKNAGPFWITVDIFCGSDAAFEQVAEGLSTERFAQACKVDKATIKRFDIPALKVVKFSLPRPKIQGAADDRDMHGAALAAVIAEIPLC